MNRRTVQRLAAAVGGVVAVVLLLLPLGPLPALGPTFNPGTGLFHAAPKLPGQLRIAGLQAPVQVNEDAYGVPHVFAQNEHDLFLAQGYLTARNRMVQLDLMRRQGEGRLAEILGEAALPSDKLQLALGLKRTAEASVARLRQEDPVGYAEVAAYTDGINAWRSEALRQHLLPPFFRLLGYQPQPWQVADSLVIQGMMAEDLAFSSGPLERAVLENHLGQAKRAALFPTLPVNPYLPYDPGPYPFSAQPDAAALQAVQLDFGQQKGPGRSADSGAVRNSPAAAVATTPQAKALQVALVDQITEGGGLFSGQFAQALGNSNNWVVAGQLTDTGQPYLAGDPHLTLTLPSIWFEVQLDAPDLHVYGVSIPGTPGIIIGHNANVAWSLTNVMNVQACYYQEETSAAHPDAYLHHGQWVAFDHDREWIPVKGSASVPFDVRWSVHGPVLPQGLPGLPVLPGKTLAMAYTGNLFSDDIGALHGLMQAKDAAEIRAALRHWGSPTQNFAYATDHNEIGILSAGYYPVLQSGDPNQLLDGRGGEDWVGLISFDQVPQAQNPTGGFLFSANQREVDANYPYNIGSSDNDFDAGYRARTIHDFLADPKNRPLTLQKMQALQGSNADALAKELLPIVRKVAASAEATPTQRQAGMLLAQWDGVMRQDQAAPALWWRFLGALVQETFGPWWQQAGLDKVKRFSLEGEPQPTGWRGVLVEHLETMLTASSDSKAYHLAADVPGTSLTWWDDPRTATHRSADQVIGVALEDAMQQCRKQMGEDPAKWQWGQIHHRLVASLTQTPAFDRGPVSADGDAFTPNAAGNEPSTAGPSWRMIADLSHLDRSVGIYPGGESGDPASPHYADQLPLWQRYQYKRLYFPARPQDASGGWVSESVRLLPQESGRKGGAP
ncbi:MAG: penicillin acylase family protein [Firmicutes bacterium]|nr:penicillin acylase family protein [Bacillota bacterium]